MTNKTITVNLNTCLRAALVAVSSYLLAYLLLGLARQVFFAVYVWTGLYAWNTMGTFLGTYRGPLVLLGTVAGLALFARWVLRPVLDDFAGLVTAALRLPDDQDAPVQPVRFPKGLERVEAEVRDLGRELRLWKVAVKEAEQRKDDLVVSLAHDIRTPLTSVLGYLELLEESPRLPEEDRQRFTGVALRKARRMQTLVDELFEITRFNVGRIELERAPVNVQVLMHQMVEELTPLAAGREIAVSAHCEGVQEIFVDPDKLARALDNILHNAVQYAQPGGEIRWVTDRDEAGRVRMRISNTGQEIDPDKLERFFEKFYRADESRGSQAGRSGLGLAIAKSIVEAHGGTITAENRDQVTTFTILLNL